MGSHYLILQDSCTSLSQMQLKVLLATLVGLSAAGRERLFKLKPRLSGCGLESCPESKPGLTTVHLVPHSHDDTGWLKTVDQYYYGAKPDVQRAGVQYIIESVVKELAKDPAKKFIQVETGFFWRWWEEKDDWMRNLTRTLVEAGQIEFTGGGWSMNDEAATHYASIIDNMEFGLHWLVDTFGECAIPTIAWQIDPFGHSKEQARLFAEMGFEGLFFARIDYNDKDERKRSQSLQMHWEGAEEGDTDSTIFTGVFDEHYSNPKGFCWDILCTDEPINDDPDLEGWNVEGKMAQFENYVNDHLRYFKDQDHIMFTMGDDFQYQNAVMNYKNMDKLILHMNERSNETGIYLTYSTPSCYLNALKGNTDMVYPIKSDDFFPYASGLHSYWTGYFTSRPSIKLEEREGARDLAVCRQLGAASKAQGDKEPEFHMHRAMGLMQHHDAVTGTEKQNVAEDYSQRLSRASGGCQRENIEKVLMLSGLDPGTVDLTQTYCPALNVSQCLVSEVAESFIVSVYNPLSWSVNPYIRIPVPSPSYTVHDQSGPLQVQAVPVPAHVLEIPGRESAANYELVVQVPEVPGLGFSQLYVHQDEEANVEISNFEPLDMPPSQTGLNVSGIQVDLQYYVGAISGQHSGAYVFRPDGSGKHSLGESKYSQAVGSLVTETTMEAGDWGVISSPSYAGVNYNEIVWQVGPIPGGKEVVVEYSSDLSSDGKFYTDANGRQMMERQRREGEAEMEASNYYPINTRLELRDGIQENLAILVDRSEGGSSLEDGQIELMVHRQCLKDDYFGVGESLEEQAFGQGLVARGSHLLVRGSELSLVRKLSQEQVLRPQLSFFATSLTLDGWNSLGSKRIYSALARQLSSPIQVLTFSRWSNDKLLLRLQHTQDKAEGGVTENVDLTGLFTEFSILSLEETTLAANQPLGGKRSNGENQSNRNSRTETEKFEEPENQLNQPEFYSDDQQNNQINEAVKEIVVAPQISFEPLQIRTFIATVSWY